MEQLQPPTDLKSGGEGQRLWQWLLGECEGVRESLPLVQELCRIADRLEGVRSRLATMGLTVSGAHGRSTKNPLCDLEVKLSGQFSKLWRILGLSDALPEEKRPVGRPPSGDTLWRG